MFGEIKFFVVLQIQQKKDGIYITQSKYIKEILKKFGMEDSRPVGTPMSTGHKLSKNDDSKEVDQTMYRSMIQKLQYVIHTRPHIVLVVGMVARFLENPRENHMMAIKRIMRYLKGTKDYDLWQKLRGNMDLKVFTNDDSSLYIKEGPDKKIVLAKIFVDDTLFIENDGLCKAFLEERSKEFEMSKFGEIKFFFGLQIQQNKNGIYITQSKYIKEILNKFGMEDSKLVGTSMCTRLKLTKDDDSKEEDQTLYRSMIRKL